VIVLAVYLFCCFGFVVSAGYALWLYATDTHEWDAPIEERARVNAALRSER
jgi:hypothetical protein